MPTKIIPKQPAEQKMQMKLQGGSSETVYGLGLIGAWVFYIGRAKTFQEGLLGFFKGIVWPAIVVYELLEFLEKK